MKRKEITFHLVHQTDKYGLEKLLLKYNNKIQGYVEYDKRNKIYRLSLGKPSDYSSFSYAYQTLEEALHSFLKFQREFLGYTSSGMNDVILSVRLKGNEKHAMIVD